MSKKTVLNELNKSVRDKIPSAGTNERLLALQLELGRISYEIEQNWLSKEKQQLRDAFNRGVVYGLLLSTNKNNNEEAYNGFDQYYKETYGDEA